MNLSMVGINFHSAPVNVREKVSFSRKHVPKTIEDISADLNEAEVALLSTCNRTELYVVSADPEHGSAMLVSTLLQRAGASPPSELEQYFYSKTGLDAAEHLIAVASSLDSMVVGETEILGQVKQAYMLAIEAQPDCKLLHALFQQALKAGKRVHTETDISRGRVSVSSIAVDFARKIFEGLSTKTAMIVGAGETSEATLQRLVEKGVESVLVVNRSMERAQSLAGRYSGRAIPFDMLAEFLPQADIVISSTSAPHCVIRVEDAKRAVATRHDVPMLYIDIAVPRDIEEGVGDIEDAYLYDIDDLQAVAEENLARRRTAVEQARLIVKEEAAGLRHDFGRSSLAPLMEQLDTLGRTIGESQIRSALGKEMFASLSESEQEELTRLVHRAVDGLLAEPRRAMRKAEQNGNWAEYSTVVRDLFGLGGRPGDGK